MQLRSARLCLDCDEVHDLQQCPSCASESFAFITRWVPVPERPQKRARPLEVSSPEALNTYREMLQPESSDAGAWRTLRRGAVGLAIVGLVGWIWRQNSHANATSDQSTDDSTQGRHGQ